MKGCLTRYKKTTIIFQAFVLAVLLAGASLSSAQDSEIKSEPVMLEQVNINQADAETIAQVLNGIGIKKAEAIVAYREENGSFNTVDDLIMVKGVGEFTVLNNQEKIIFEQ